MSTKKALEPVVGVLAGMAGRILLSSRRRRTEQMIAGLSNRELEDMGFERDWDGSIYRASANR